MCNCNNRNRCPFNGECLTPASVYQGSILVPDADAEKYIGISEPVVKSRWSDHMTSCGMVKYRTKSTLSKKWWALKDSGLELDRYKDTKFEILKKSVPYRAGGKKCDLCLSEKLLIMKNEKEVINKRDEFVSKCRHSQKFMLGNFFSKNRKSSGRDMT